MSPDNYKRNDPCPCQSGKPYKFCHQPIFDAAYDEMLPVAQREYELDWRGNSSHYRDQGLYESLAGELVAAGSVAKVLDIGSGRGEGIEALRGVLPQDHLIVGIDENPKCLEVAAVILGLSADAVSDNRIAVTAHQDKTYEISLVPGRLKPIRPVTLIQSDVLLEDGELVECLSNAGPFDAITLWFTGIHKAKQSARAMKERGITSDAVHRQAVEDAAASLGSLLLRPGGWLQLASRGAHSDETAIKSEYEPEMLDLGQTNGFDLRTISARPYTEPSGGRRLGVRSLDFDRSGLKLFVLSALFQKPS